MKIKKNCASRSAASVSDLQTRWCRNQSKQELQGKPTTEKVHCNCSHSDNSYLIGLERLTLCAQSAPWPSELSHVTRNADKE